MTVATGEQVPMFSHDSWFGKMSMEHSAVTEVRTSAPCWKKLRGLQNQAFLFLDMRGGRWTNAGAIIGDGWSVAWRTHDAQYWGVPQRRRRISLVADFGGGSAPEILFESESLSGDSAESGETREGTSGNAKVCAYPAVAGTLKARYDGSANPDIKSGQEIIVTARTTVMAFSQNGEGVTIESPIANSLTTRQNPAGRGTAMIYGFQPQAGGNTGCAIMRDAAPCLGTTQTPAVYDARGNGDGEITPTITGDHENRVTDYTAICIGNGQAHIASHITKEVSQTLNCMHDAMAVVVAVDCRNGTENEVNGTLQSKPSGGTSVNLQNICRVGMIVRRLTPLECERLQAFPDHWTDIGEWTDEKGKKRQTTDSARYRALGNSIARPFWSWLLRRIMGYCREKTMGSLFDGIGGFPLCWNLAGGETLWASEIEPFCIAVTKKHFGDEATGEKGDWIEFFQRG